MAVDILVSRESCDGSSSTLDPGLVEQKELFVREDLDSIETSVQSDRVAATTPQVTGSAQLLVCHTMTVCAMSDW